jgi:hypothetical protein
MDTLDTILEPPAPRPRYEYLLISIFGIVAAADICFWDVTPGVSFGLFALIAGLIIVLNRAESFRNRRTCCIFALLIAAACESANSFSFSNGLVLLILLGVLAGESWYLSLPPGWSRWSETIWSSIKTPGQWIWLLQQISKKPAHDPAMPRNRIREIARIFWILLPGLVITLVFTLLLLNGNALFAHLAEAWTQAIQAWLESLDISFPRCFFWLWIAWCALPLLRPSDPAKAPRIWTKEFPRIPELASASTGRLQSAVALALLNILFCCVNSIDAVYLWAHQTLPEGVSYSQFVHSGVTSLIMATIFSALLLAALFHQAQPVADWKPLKWLSIIWIIQNLLLLAGVVLRVKLYVDAYDLTLTRVNLVFFLGLVAAGFVLLGIYILTRRTLGWLLNANMLAVFALFFLVQFPDTKGFVARYNLKLWIDSHGTRTLDLDYLKMLGPSAYDSIAAVGDGIDSPLTTDARDYLNTMREQARLQLQSGHWQSWQLRDWRGQRKLLAGKP